MLRSRLLSLATLLFVVAGVPLLVAACKKTSASTPAQCEETRAAATTRAHAAASAAASSCVTANDCVEIDRASCDFGCSGYAVAATARGSAAAAIAKVDGESCKEWRERDCAKIAPLPVASCASPRVACRKDRCVMRYPWEDLSADQCNVLLAEGDKEIAEALQGASPGCTKDSDCKVVSEHACFPDCGGVPISADFLSAYEAVRKRVEEHQCAKWHDGDCMATTPRPTPSCMPVKARCLKSKIAKPTADRYPPGHCIIDR